MTAALKEIFNEPERNNWISRISQIEYDMVLTFNFKPPDSGNLEDNLGTNLSPKIKAFYDRFKKNDSIQNLIISIHIPLEIYPGSKDWVPIVSFAFDRDTYERINWRRFNSERLLNYSQNVQWSDMTSF